MARRADGTGVGAGGDVGGDPGAAGAAAVTVLDALADGVGPDAVCAMAVAGLRPVLGVDAAAVAVMRQGRLERMGRAGRLPQGVLVGGSAQLDGEQVPARCVREGAIVVEPPAGGSAGGRSVIGVPLVVRGRAIGALVVAAAPVRWTVVRVRAVQAVADVVALWVTPQVPPPVDPVTEALTARQERVLALLARGRSNPEIAAELGCSVSTVKGEVQALLRALRAADRHEAVAAAAARGLLEGSAP